MSYKVELEAEAAKALTKIPPPDQGRIYDRAMALADDPRPAGCEKLKGFTDAYRVRQGNYRIVYTIDDVLTIVTITRIAQRGQVYR